jgi:hypothetical protein
VGRKVCNSEWAAYRAATGDIVKVTKEEQPFWDHVFLLGMKEHVERVARQVEATRASEEAAVLADVALAARRARSQ